MGRLYDDVTYGQPVLDHGWRVALYPAGTLLADAVTQETLLQAEHGRAVVPGSAVLLQAYWVRTTGDYLAEGEQRSTDSGWRDVVALTRAVPVRYRVTGPGIHTL